MKKIFVFATAVAVSLSMSAQKQMHVWVNGNAINLPISQVDSVTFTDPNASDPNIPDPNPNPDPSTANGIGVFSVAEGKTVSFAPGNLQYNAVQGSHLRADGTKAKGTWRFAEKQWDYVGYDNRNIAENYDGWIDLFGWGTSGYDNTANDPLSIFYQPWSKSDMSLTYVPKDSTLNCDSYEITGECEWEYTYFTSSEQSKNERGYGPSTKMQDDGLYGTSAYYDWGVYNAISNGGNQAGSWRSLTKAEWEYLLDTRKNAQFLRSRATVNNVKGYVLLPDDFKKPSDIAWSHQTNDWTTNTYSAEQWSALEALGAVFLPASYYRYGSSVSYGTLSGYWSASEGGDNGYGARYFDFYSRIAPSMTIYYRSHGRSVRLVKDL